MVKLTARNSTFLHNAKLFFNGQLYKHILHMAQEHGEHTAIEYVLENHYADTNNTFEAIFCAQRFETLGELMMFDPSAAPVAADTAPTVNAETWTPAVGMLVRFKQGIVLYGDNHDVDAIQGMGVVGKITRMDDGITVDFGLDGSYVCFADELEPASPPATAQPVNADAAGDAEPDGAGVDFGLQNKIDTLKYDLGIADDHIREQDQQIAALTRDLADAQAEAVALERELEAVKQAFDGYQSAALESEQAHARAMELLVEASNPFRVTYELTPKLTAPIIIPNQRNEKPQPRYGDLLYLLTAIDAAIPAAATALATVAAERAAADTGMVAALKAHDNGRRTSADNVLAMFADDDEGTIA